MKDSHQAEYEFALRSAYEGELVGAKLYAHLANVAGEPDAQKGFMAIANVERATFKALESIAQCHGIAPRHEHIDSLVLRRIGELSCIGWHEFLQKANSEWPNFIARFEALHLMAPDEDKAALERLIEHEVALVNFVKGALTGNPMESILQPLSHYCAITNR